MEAGGDDPRTHGQLASIDLFQAAAPEQACHLVVLLLLPNRRQSLVANRRVVVLRVCLIRLADFKTRVLVTKRGCVMFNHLIHRRRQRDILCHRHRRCHWGPSRGSVSGRP